MPQFRFLVEDSSKKMRSGRVSASSLEEARCKIEATGLKILELSDEQAPQIQVSHSGSPVRVARAEPRPVESTTLQRGLEFFEETSRSDHFPKLLAAVGVVGLVLGVVLQMRKPTPTPRVVASPTRHQVSIEVSGSVECDGPLEGAALSFELPALNYHSRVLWEQLEHPRAGSYVWKFSGGVTSAPEKLRVSVSQDGFVTQSSSYLAVTRTGRVEVPTLRLRPAPRVAKTPLGRPQADNVPARPAIPGLKRPP